MFISDVHVWHFTMTHILPPFSKNKPLLKNNHQLVGGLSLIWQSLLLFCLFFANTAHFLLDEIMIAISNNTDGHKLLRGTGNPHEPDLFLQLSWAISVPQPMLRFRASGGCPGCGDAEQWTWLHGILSEGKSVCLSAFSWCWTIPSWHMLKSPFALIFLWAKEKMQMLPFPILVPSAGCFTAFLFSFCF